MEDKYEISSQLLELLDTYGKATTPATEFSRDIFVLDTRVNGIYYAMDNWPPDIKFRRGQRLILRREPDNKHDELAILVLNKKEIKLGYIPKTNNEVIARLMDAGKEFYAKVIAYEVEYDGLPDLGINDILKNADLYIRVFMIDRAM